MEATLLKGLWQVLERLQRVDELLQHLRELGLQQKFGGRILISVGF
jgi:hypothetical protein